MVVKYHPENCKCAECRCGILSSRVAELEIQRARIIEGAVTLASFRMPSHPGAEWEASFRATLEAIN
jgi:hypothetical protein